MSSNIKKVIGLITVIVLVGGGFLIFNKSSQNNGVEILEGNNQEEVSNNPQNFTHPDLGFSFTYPPQYELTVIPESLGESILIQKEGSGMQLYITDFAGTAFNSALVKKEITDVKLQNVIDITLPSGIPAVSFSYNDVSLGEVWNVWFISGEKLYQLTMQVGHDDALKVFVETFKFE